MAAGFGEVVYEVVADAEDEAWIALGVDQAVCSPQGLKGGLRLPHLGEQESL